MLCLSRRAPSLRFSLSFSVLTYNHSFLSQTRAFRNRKEKKERMVIYAISDVHTDYPDNLQWVESVPNDKYKNDTLIVPGDVTDNLARLRYTLQQFVNKFKHVFFCPGNHELWVNKEDKENQILDSFTKFNRIVAMCKEIGVHISTEEVEGVTIVPLFAWHDNSLHQPESFLVSDLNLWSDTFRCVWPQNMSREDIAKHFVELNRKHLPDPTKCGTIITYSHFFPSNKIMTEYRAELARRFQAKREAAIASGLPPPEMKDKYPNFSLVAGTELLDPLISSLHPVIHLYGHSHRKMEIVVGQTRYLNQPLGYPLERKNNLIAGPFEPYQIFP